MTIKINELNDRIKKLRSMGYSESDIQASVERLKSAGEIEEDTFGKKVGRVARGVVEPFEKFGRTAMALGAAGTGLAQGLMGDEEAMKRSAQKGYEMLLPSQQEAYMGTTGDATLEGLKMGAGIAPFGLPGGQTLKQATALGAVGGAGRGFYETSPDQALGENLKTVGKGTLGGAVSGAAFYQLGQLGQKVRGQGLKETGQGLQKKAVLKEFGNPRKNLGGAKLLDDMDNVGIKTNNLDDMAGSASDILNRETQKITQTIDDLGDVGVDSTVEAVKKSLKEQMSKQGSSLQKKHYQELLDLLDEDLPKGATLSDLFRAKQSYGAYTKPGFAGGPGENEKAKAFNFLYGKIKEQLDDIIDKSGKESLKQSNKAVSTAIRTLDYVDDAVRRGKDLPNGIGFQDVILGSIGAGGGPTGMLTLPALARSLRSPTGMRIMGKTLEAGGNALGGMASKLAPVGQALGQQSVQRIGQPVMSQLGSQAFTGSLGGALQSPQVDTGSLEREFQAGDMGLTQQQMTREGAVTLPPTRDVGMTQDNMRTNQMVDAGILPESRREIYPQQPTQPTGQPQYEVTPQGTWVKDGWEYDPRTGVLTEQAATGQEAQGTDIFGGKTKLEVLQEAAVQGADFNVLKQLSDYYDILTEPKKPMGLDIVQQAISGGMTKSGFLQALAVQGADISQIKDFGDAYDMLKGDETDSKYKQLETEIGDSIRDVLSSNKLSAVSGVWNLGTLVPGTESYDLAAQLQNIKDKLQLRYAELLKGGGSISDAERRILASATSVMNQKGISEKRLREELQRIAEMYGGK